MRARELKIASLVLCCASSFLYAPQSSAKSVTGMVDAKGEPVLPVKYDDISAVGPDEFRVVESKKDEQGKSSSTTFRVDSSGKVISTPAVVPGPPQPWLPPTRNPTRLPEGWKSMESFDFGDHVCCDDNRQGFVDLKGKLTIFPSDQDIRPIGPKLFLRYSYNDVDQTIELLGPNLQAVAALPPEIEVHGKFSDGLLKVRVRSSMIVGFLNTEGKWQIKPSSINEADDFKNGFSKVELTLRGKSACAVIDRNGHAVAGPYENGCFPFQSVRDGQLVVEIMQQRAGVVTTSGKVVIPLEYDFILEENDYYVGRRDGNWIVFTRDGKILVTLPKTICYVKTNVKDGMWIFAEGGDPKKLHGAFRGSPYPGSKFGLMRTNGKVVVPATFDYIAEVSGNLAMVGEYTASGSVNYGVIDSLGKIVLPMKYKTISIANGAILIHEELIEFDSERWKKFSETNMRGDSWDNFLVSHDLIGMPLEQAFSILGKPDAGSKTISANRCRRERYSLGSSFCGNSWAGIEIEFDDEKKVATGWRSVGFDWDGEWNRDNVVYVATGPYGSKRLVPKSVAEQYR